MAYLGDALLAYAFLLLIQLRLGGVYVLGIPLEAAMAITVLAVELHHDRWGHGIAIIAGCVACYLTILIRGWYGERYGK